MAGSDPLELRLTPAAERDLEAIWAYTVETWSEAQAEQYLDLLSASFERLTLFPHLARERTEFTPPVRIHQSAAHVIVYRAEADHLAVIRVLGGRQDWAAVLAALD